MRHAAFEAWKNLKFDPAKDDVEEFMTTIKNLASTLAFNKEAQVMAIKSNMPRDIYGLCMQYDKLDELKRFLIELFENPRMKSAVPSITAEAETSMFSMGEFVNNDVVSATSEDIGKLKNEISALQFKVRRMMPSDSRNKPNPKPWKPEVTPPKRKGNNFRGRGFRQNDSGRRDNSSSGQNNNSGRDRNFSNRSQSGSSNGNRKPFGNRSQNNGNFGGNQRGRGRGRFHTSPNVRRPRVASKTVNKNKGRCFYCNEFGHFIKECSKKTEDERFRRYSRMNSDYHHEGQYSDYDDTGLYTDDYDDEVFVTLNSLEELGESTTQTPPDKLPRYIPDSDKLCLSREQAEHVYETVENGEQVKPLIVNSSVDEEFSVVNSYTIGLRTNTDSSLKKEPSLEMKKCDLTWSILSTVVDYTECDKNSPYREMNCSPVYSRFIDAKHIVHDDTTDHWQEI